MVNNNCQFLYISLREHLHQLCALIQTTRSGTTQCFQAGFSVWCGSVIWIITRCVTE